MGGPELQLVLVRINYVEITPGRTSAPALSLHSATTNDSVSSLTANVLNGMSFILTGFCGFHGVLTMHYSFTFIYHFHYRLLEMQSL